MEKENDKRTKLSFFKRFKLSLINLEQYHIIAEETIPRSIKYLLIMFLIFACITATVTTIQSKKTLNEVTKKLENISDFKIENDEFSIESDEKVMIENNDLIKIRLLFDNSEDTEKYMQNGSDKYDGTEIIFTKTRLIVKSDSEKTIEFGYDIITDKLSDKNINKEKIINFLQNRSELYFSIFTYVFIFIFTIYFTTGLIDVFCLALLGYIVSRMVKLPLKFFAVFSMAASSMTLPIILNLVYIIARIFTGFEMSKFQLMYTLVSYIYIISAILILRSNLIKTNFKIEEKIKKKIENKDDANNETDANESN